MSASPSVTLLFLQIDLQCVSDINAWMRSSRLQVNKSKMQIIWLGSGQQVRQVSICEVQVLSSQVQKLSMLVTLALLYRQSVIAISSSRRNSVVLATISLNNCVQLFGR